MTHPNDLAYPCNVEYTGEGEHGVPTINTKTSFGLTKREYFASLFTQAIVSSIDGEPNYQRIKALAKRQEQSVSQWIATDAVKQADALIEILNQ